MGVLTHTPRRQQPPHHYCYILVLHMHAPAHTGIYVICICYMLTHTPHRQQPPHTYACTRILTRILAYVLYVHVIRSHRLHADNSPRTPRPFSTQFTCFAGTKVQILTLRTPSLHPEAAYTARSLFADHDAAVPNYKAYYFYRGSRTEPPCDQNWRWVYIISILGIYYNI